MDEMVCGVVLLMAWIGLPTLVFLGNVLFQKRESAER